MTVTQVSSNTQFPSFYHRKKSVKFLKSFAPILKNCAYEQQKVVIEKLYSLVNNTLEDIEKNKWGKFDAPTGGNRCQLAACMITLLARDPSLSNLIDTVRNNIKSDVMENFPNKKLKEQATLKSLCDVVQNLFKSNSTSVKEKNLSSSPEKTFSKSKEMRYKTNEIFDSESSTIIDQNERKIPHHLLFLIYNYILSHASIILNKPDEKGFYFTRRQIRAGNVFNLTTTSITAVEAEDLTTEDAANVVEITRKLTLHMQIWINREAAEFMQYQCKIISFPDQPLLEKLTAIGRDIIGHDGSNVIVKRHETPFFLVTEMVFAALHHYKCPFLLKVRPLSKEKESLSHFVYQKFFICEQGDYLSKEFDPNLNEPVFIIEAFSHLSTKELKEGDKINELIARCGERGILDFIKFSAAKHPQFTVGKGETSLDLSDLLNQYPGLESLKEKYGHLAEEALHRRICREADFQLCCIQHIYCDFIGIKKVPNKVIIHA